MHLPSWTNFQCCLLLLDYQVFCLLTKQGRVQFDKAPPLFRHKILSKKEFYELSPDVKAEWLEDYHALQERIRVVLRQMPTGLFFIFR